MKIKFLYISIILFAFSSCKYEPRPPYEYEKNPEYTEIGFSNYGQYYENNPNHVVSFSFFSEGMLNENKSSIVAPGQYLMIDDIFVSEDRIRSILNATGGGSISELQLLTLLKGEYKMSESGDSRTFFPGEYFPVDSVTYVLGARIEYYEKEDSNSIRKLITDGSFTIDENGVKFNLVTDDDEKLYGNYEYTTKDRRNIKVEQITKQENRYSYPLLY